MNILHKPLAPSTQNGPTVPLLANGDCMGQAEFHRRYQACTEDEKYELVGGIVFMASPVRGLHGLYHLDLGTLLKLYSYSTPGVEAYSDATTILGEQSEPQPDLSLRILSEFGGRSGMTVDEYITGPPELLGEIALSSRSLDMNQKRQDYEQAGVLEYLVVCVEEAALHWFHFASGGLITANRQGICRSRVFPGLWIHGDALLNRASSQLLATLQQGLASRAHAAFVKRLARARKRQS